MISTPIETSLYQRLTPFFTKRGYVLLPDRKQYRRIVSTGFQNIILSPVFYGNKTTLDVNFGCRNEQIEQIAQQFLNNMPDFRSEANTLVTSIGKFSDLTYSPYKIHSMAELNDACQQIQHFFGTHGFNFLNNVSSLAPLDRILNEPPHLPCAYMYNQTHRCYKALIAARLNHNPLFNILIDNYRQLLIQQTQNPYEQLHFERLIAYLHHYSAN